MKRSILFIIGMIIAAFAIAAVPSDIKDDLGDHIQKVYCERMIVEAVVPARFVINPECRWMTERSVAVIAEDTIIPSTAKLANIRAIANSKVRSCALPVRV